MGAGHTHALHVHEHSVVHRLAPEVKLAAAFAFVLVVGVTPPRAMWAFAVHAAALVAVLRLSRVAARFVATRMLAVLPFVLFAFMIPFIAGGEAVSVLGLSLSREGLWGTWNIVAKALIGITVSVLLAATTQIPDILRGLERLRAPWVLTAIAGFMVRYLELIADEMGRMRIAMKARGFRPRWLWDARPVASSAGALFVRSYERGERIHAAMVARGYRGVMPRLHDHRPTSTEWLAAASFILVPASVAAVALLAG